MEQVIVIHKDKPVACIPVLTDDTGCVGCQAYDPDDIDLCLSVSDPFDCISTMKLAAIQVHTGTRFEAETQGGRLIKNALVHAVVEWREHPLQVYWEDELGKHIEPFALHEFKKFKFL